MKHYSEVELLEHYYLTGDNQEIRDHVASCSECGVRYERLREKLSCSALVHQQGADAKPETFWTGQRAAITREIARRQQSDPGPAVWRFAVAAVLTLLAAGVIVVSINQPENAPQAVEATDPPAATETAMSALEGAQPFADPWESDELQPYGELVQWESWLAETGEGGTS